MLANSKYGKIKLMYATRFVYMKLDPEKKFKNFYWLEGPLPGDQGRRITVLYYNQSQGSVERWHRELSALAWLFQGTLTDKLWC